jgi:two-component system CheB/CheR fusion protein
MAFILVQHLAPDHKSILSELVRRYTRLRVFEVEDGMEVYPNCAYIIPPNRDMGLSGGVLRLYEPSAARGPRLPIDFFLTSLATDQGHRAIGVVLSGMGADGARGVRAIAGQGGLTMAQAPASTEYEGMPASAIATGVIDFVLRPEEMLAQLVDFVAGRPRLPREPVQHVNPDGHLARVCAALRAQTGHNFAHYKPSTLGRRLERRMALQKIDAIDDYVRFAEQSPEELEALYRDLLIGVTHFFRDPDAFATLEALVVPGASARPHDQDTIRIWVVGCSSGEEAYSIAMLFQEHLESKRLHHKILIFATDIDDRAIARARAGVYPASVAGEVSPERLERFFVADEQAGTYRVRKRIRDLVVFSEQDVMRDPPFSRLDLISCRNVMIYLNPEAQKKLIPVFHYALSPGGTLFLGSSETVSEFGALFAPIDRTWKLFSRRQSVKTPAPPALTAFAAPAPPRVITASLGPRQHAARSRGADLAALVERTLLEHWGQACVLVDSRGEILHVVGRTGRYLEPAPGAAQMNVLAMARDGLQRGVSMALHRSVSTGAVVRYGHLRLETGGEEVGVDLTVRPVERRDGPDAIPEMWLVVFEEAALVGRSAVVTNAPAAAPPVDDELQAKDDYLLTVLEEMETANDELQTANEEFQSVNEELQSANEELETSKEELQSLNEELTTVASELHMKVADLSRANNDMNNMLAGTGIGTLFVDNNLRISRFTPAVVAVINLIEGDVGRPVGHVVSNLVGYDSLAEDAAAVLDTLAQKEAEVRTKDGGWYLMRIRPYRTLENVIEGAVITFADIASRKRAERSLLDARRLAKSIVSTAREALVVLDAELRVVMANRPFALTFGVTPEEAEGRRFFELSRGRWEFPELRRLLEELPHAAGPLDDVEVTGMLAGSEQLVLTLNASYLRLESTSDGALILLAITAAADRDDR